MNIRENIRIAIFSIRTNLLRSLLTMLGIIIGVASVIAIITVGNGGRDYIVGMIQDMGQSAITIQVNQKNTSSSDYITDDDLKAMKGQDSIDYVSPFLLGMGTFKANSESGMCFPVGCAPDMEQISKLSASYGRMFTEEEYEAARNVCIIDGMNAKGLFGYENVVGEYIEVTVGDKTARLRIIGVMDVSAMMGGMDNEAMMEQMSQMTNTMGNMCYVIAPAPVVANLMGSSGRYNMVYLSAKDENQLDAAGNAAKNILQARHNNFDREAYTVTNMATYIELLDKVINVFTTFIAAVSAISLVVGGIGVMNIMYVSVSERTREIGIRKALGARTRTILFQFLTESVILCLIGGIIGMILGISGAGVVSYIMDIPMSVKFSTLLISVGFSSAIGIFFGIYPARKAAKMPPIEALRRD